MSELEMKLISLSVRLTKSERTLLQTKADKLGCSKSEYVRKILADREIKQTVISQVDRDAYQKLAQLKLELTRQGVNLNQIARAVNYGQAMPQELTLQLAELIRANRQSQVDIGVCKAHILMGKTDDWKN